MRALCWHGKGDVRVVTVPGPTIEHSPDAIVKITACDDTSQCIGP
jgi:threonine dehydrogenase-like Zn-dependent dehydrogenase